MRNLSAPVALVVLALLLGVTGCGGGEPDAEPEGATVELEVVEGPQGHVLAFVPVWVAGAGPFRFALDTGASQSLVDEEIAERLELERRGTGPVTGIVGATQADRVDVPQWRVGDVELPASTIVTLDLGVPDDAVHLRGLLGSDVLSQFDVITLDYGEGVLTLGE